MRLQYLHRAVGAQFWGRVSSGEKPPEHRDMGRDKVECCVSRWLWSVHSRNPREGGRSSSPSGRTGSSPALSWHLAAAHPTMAKPVSCLEAVRAGMPRGIGSRQGRG